MSDSGEKSGAKPSKREAEADSKQAREHSTATARETLASSTNESQPASLPLGWTQVQRRRRTDAADATDSATTTTADFDWSVCCDDPNCRRQRLPAAPSTLSATTSEASTAEDPNVTRGLAIICLQEINPDWFQGYFLPDQAVKPWGMLGVQETLDECLECADGGYRQITLTIYPYGTRGNSQNKKKDVVFPSVQWTGGDMMRLYKQEALDESTSKLVLKMETHCMWTGSKSVPYMVRYFSSLLRRAREEEDEEASNDRSVLELLPDVAILVGPMSICLPPDTSDKE